MDQIEIPARRLGSLLCGRGLTMATAESCTGGLVAAACTDVPGASAWFAGGVVAYANAAKTALLGVAPESIAAHGAVSEAVVLAMAAGACRAVGADVAVAVSGVAGPAGGSPEKPVGTVWIAWQGPGFAVAEKFLFAGDRAAVRAASVDAALQGLAGRL